MPLTNLKFWDHNVVDCPSVSVATLVATLRGGESITIKSVGTAGESHYFGHDRTVTTKTGYKNDTGETVTFTLPITFGNENHIEIWALPTLAGDDVSYFKLIDLEPETAASE